MLFRSQTRVELKKAGLIVDIFIAEQCRGRGYAVKALTLLKEAVHHLWPNKRLVAEIKQTNKSSIALFLKAGYQQVRLESGFCILENK